MEINVEKHFSALIMKPIFSLNCQQHAKFLFSDGISLRVSLSSTYSNASTKIFQLKMVGQGYDLCPTVGTVELKKFT